MAINVTQGGYWAAPRMRVMCGGTPLPNLLRATVERPNRYHAATFRLEFALAEPGDDGDEVWWSLLGPSDTTGTGAQPPPQTEVVQVVLQVGLRARGADEGLAGVQWQTLLQGLVDDYTIDMRERCVSVHGRDLTALFLDNKTANAYVNQTSSQIATALAAEHGLQANVTATTTPVHRYYQDEHDKITLGQFHRTTTEWDLLTFLAQNEQDASGRPFDVRVDGNTLYFGPGPDPNSAPWVLRWEVSGANVSTNVLDLHMHRSLTMSRDMVVKVISWNSQAGRRIVATSVKSRGITTSPYAQQYVLRRANLTLDQAQKLADATLHELSLHERVIEFSAPGDLKLTPYVIVAVQGTKTSFDQVYYVDTMTQEYDIERGFLMHARCKNTSPVSQVSAS